MKWQSFRISFVSSYKGPNNLLTACVVVHLCCHDEDEHDQLSTLCKSLTITSCLKSMFDCKTKQSLIFIFNSLPVKGPCGVIETETMQYYLIKSNYQTLKIIQIT